jgi:hypothetical protein
MDDAHDFDVVVGRTKEDEIRLVYRLAQTGREIAARRISVGLVSYGFRRVDQFVDEGFCPYRTIKSYSVTDFL